MMTTKRPLTIHFFSLAGILVSFALISLYNFLVFHYLVELFSVAIGAMIFVIVWNNRSRIADSGLMVIGVSYLFVALIDFFHALSYAGTGLFAEYAPDMPTQLWLVARYIQSISLLAGLFLSGRRARPVLSILIYTLVTILVTSTVFPLRLFPVAYRIGTGPTMFKLASEFLIVAILTAALVLLIRRRKRFSSESWGWILVSIVFTIVAELLFTGYLGVHDLVNVFGHYAETVAFYCMYQAYVVVGIREPQEILYRELSQAIADRETLLKEVHHRVKNNIQLILALIGLEEGDATPSERSRLQDLTKRINTIGMIHDRLSRTETSRELDLSEYLNDIVRRLSETIAPVPVSFIDAQTVVPIESRQAISLALIVSELTTNIFKHSFGRIPQGTMELRISSNDDTTKLQIIDNGEAWSPNIPDAERSLGTTIVNELSNQIRAGIDHDRIDGYNYTTVTFPTTTARA